MRKVCASKFNCSESITHMRLSPVVIPSVIGLTLLANPANATQLESWNFDSAKNQIHITTDSSVKPKAFVIANPTRLVVDLPGTNLDKNTVRRSVSSSQVKEIRVGEPDNKTTRFVVELAPGYTLAPERLSIRGDSDTHWIVNFNAIQRGDSNGSSEDKVPVQVGSVSPFAGVVPLGNEIAALDSQVRSLVNSSRYRHLDTGFFFLDLETGNYLDFNGEKIFPAASTIKFPILVALFQEIDAGRIKLNETLTLSRSHITEGSGNMQYKRPGSKFSLLETATQMMTVSDNTATNMIIDRLGGLNRLNQRFRSWGMQNTVMRNMLGDFKGTNTSSAKDLVRLSALIANNQLLSPASRSRTLDIMYRVKNRSYLPSGLGSGAKIAHKTGTLAALVGDAGIVRTPSGRSYLAGIFVSRPRWDDRGVELVRRVSQIFYGHVSQTRVTSR